MGLQFYVAHGASGSSASMAGHVRGLVRRGIDAEAIDLPLKKAEAAVPAFLAIVPGGAADPGGKAPDEPGGDEPGADGRDGDQRLVAVGGQSYGGRVASLAAALPDTRY